jgi:hypothetical protein
LSGGSYGYVPLTEADAEVDAVNQGMQGDKWRVRPPS